MLCACWQHHRGSLETGGVFPAWKVRKTSLREVSNTEVQEPFVLWPQPQTTCPLSTVDESIPRTPITPKNGTEPCRLAACADSRHDPK